LAARPSAPLSQNQKMQVKCDRVPPDAIPVPSHPTAYTSATIADKHLPLNLNNYQNKSQYSLRTSAFSTILLQAALKILLSKTDPISGR
jgi:uncharacterized membrane protein